MAKMIILAPHRPQRLPSMTCSPSVAVGEVPGVIYSLLDHVATRLLMVEGGGVSLVYVHLGPTLGYRADVGRWSVGHLLLYTAVVPNRWHGRLVC